MARSPSHRFGQIIGDLLEASFLPTLREFANTHDLFLDTKGKRTARKGKKVTWIDAFGNSHDLDFVLERGGRDDKVGIPVAFIETAWRRYTKHSRNKAQEIQGAVLPLVTTYHNTAPFYGAILAGEYTRSAITQLQSHGFKILYFPYETMISAFAVVGVDAFFDEFTSEAELTKKVQILENLTTAQQTQAISQLFELNKDEIHVFMESLEHSILRQIQSVYILPLHGVNHDFHTIEEAIQFISEYTPKNVLNPVIKYEVVVHYTNSDQIKGEFSEKADAMRFLESYKPPSMTIS